MSDLHFYQEAFFKAQFDDDQSQANKLIVPFGLNGEQRLSIYRNNTFITLTEALSQTFPVIQKLVGEEFFSFTAEEFIKDTPPAQGPLFEYGGEFSEFLDTFEPASSLAYLSDIARLEWAINQSYHAENLTSVDVRDLSEISEEKFKTLRFLLHPSCRILKSKHPVYDIWLFNQDDTDQIELDLDKTQNVLVARPDDEIKLKLLSPELTCFLTSLENNSNIEKAYLETIELSSDFDPAQAMVELLSFGTFSNIIKTTNPPH